MTKNRAERRIDLPSGVGRATNYTAGATGADGLAAHAHDGTANSGGILDDYAAAVHAHDWADISGYLASLDYMDNIVMAGRLWGGIISDNGDGTVHIAEGGGLVKEDDAGPQDVPASTFDGQGGYLSYVEWAEVASLSLTDDAYNYIYYDKTDGQIKATTDFYGISFTEDFTLGRGYRSGTNVIVRLCGTNVWNFNRRVQLFGEEYIPVVRARGMVLGETGTRNITVTAGILWAELVNRFTTDAVDTSAGGTFTAWYRNGSGGWTSVTGQTQINNTQYDDGDGTLGTLSNNRFGVHWVYVVHDSSVHVVYGRDNYLQPAAEASTPPADVPGLLAAYASLVGRIIIQKSAASFTSVDSAFTQTFATSGVVDHGDLSGLTDANSHPASAISTVTTAFNGVLDGAADNVQAALSQIDQRGMMVKMTVDSGDTLTIPAGWQQLIWGAYTVSGTLEIGGEMVIL